METSSASGRRQVDRVVRYVEGIGRNPGEEYGRSHLYAVMENGDHVPMCMYGWNCSDGEALSIFRGHR